jgi:hypothetical protein
MGDFHAIGGVSATLHTLLQDRMEKPDDAPTFTVTVGTPKFGPKDNEPVEEKPRINLFLYRVTENGFLQNQDIPGRGSAGAFGHPPLSLKLHYLLTAYGSKKITTETSTDVYDETLAHFLLGSAMRVLHDFPVITEQLTTVSPPSGRPVLDASLRGEFERIKLTLDPVSLEDVTKVWTALALRYRVSAAYSVSVVQIESRRPRRFPQQVGEPPSPRAPFPSDPPVPGPMVQVITLRTPTITELRVRRVGEISESRFAYARIGDTLVLRGTNLGGDAAQIEIGDVVVTPLVTKPDQLETILPDTSTTSGASIPLEQRLQPGPLSVVVAVTEPGLRGRVVRSQPGVFLLVPTVSGVSSAAAAGFRQLTVQGDRLYSETRSGETVIGRVVVGKSAYVTPTPTTITLPLPDVLPMRRIVTLISGPLPASVTFDSTDLLELFVGGVSVGTTKKIEPTGFRTRSALPVLLQAVMRDVAPDNPAVAGLRVGLVDDRLLIVAGGMTQVITVADPAGSTMAAKLSLTNPAPAGAANALISGELKPFPRLSAPNPRMGLRIGASPVREIGALTPASLLEAVSTLENAIRAADPAAAFANALVGTVGNQIVVVPGAAGDVFFSGTTTDTTTVAELQLAAHYGVRVRVNGAESFAGPVLDLPEP